MSDNIRRMPNQTARGKKKTGRKKDKGLKRLFYQSGSIDVVFCCLVMILFAIGVTMLYSASYAYAAQYSSGGSITYFKSQIVSGIIGFVLMYAISRIDYRVFNGIITPIAYIATVLLLIYTYIVNRGASIKRWITVMGRQFQPSEIAKFVMIITLAYLLCVLHRPISANRNDKRTLPNIRRLTGIEKRFFSYFDNNRKSMYLVAVAVAVITGLVFLESHLSCTILLFTLGVSIMWLGGFEKKYFVAVILFVAAAVTVVVVWPEILKPISKYGYERIVVWKTKADFGNTTYWQTKQGLLAIASGGPFGVGFGKSVQKQLYIPEPQNDFIFPVVIEELGFVGAAIIILLFALLIFRGFTIATKSRDLFGSLLVSGIMLQVGLQVLLNIAVVTDFFPNTGIALPFFSYGGTALVILMCEMGVVLSVSRRTIIDVPEHKEAEIIQMDDYSDAQ